jgi:hypothetical protein
MGRGGVCAASACFGGEGRAELLPPHLPHVYRSSVLRLLKSEVYKQTVL